MVRGFILPPFPTATPGQSAEIREKINWIYGEEEGLRQGRENGKTVIIDFWAEWCAACKEFDKFTYADPEIIRELRRFVNVKIDSTKSDDPKIKQLWEKYGIVGLPAVVFINQNGTMLSEKTITGFVNAREFLKILKGLE